MSPSTVVLLLIALSALALRFQVAKGQSISYDGWWHVWIACQDRWKIGVAEYRANAHPPLFYLFIRSVSAFTSNVFVYRSCTILPGVISTFLVGVIVRKLTRHSATAFVTAAAYGFSRNSVEISTDIRSYSLCICFVLLAFYFYVDLVRLAGRQASVRSLWGFSICSALAIASEYYAVLFLISCLGLIAGLAIISPSYRQTLDSWAPRSKWASLGAVALPIGVLQYLYRTHIRLQPQFGYNHISEFYWNSSSHEAPTTFLIRNSQILWNTFTVFPVHTTPDFLACAVAVTAVILVAVIRIRGVLGNRSELLVPILILGTLVLQLMAFSLVRKYPFGGLMRQQSIILPFVFIVTGLVFQALISRLPQALRRVLLIGVCFGLVVNLRASWADMSAPGWDASQAEYNDFAAKSAGVDGVLLDQFNLIIYYAHNSNFHWKFDQRVVTPVRFDSYHVSSPDGKHMEVVRSKEWWNFDFSKPAFYSNVAAILHATSIRHLAVFCNYQGISQFTPAVRQQLFSDVSVHAGEAGLSVDTLTTKQGEVTAVFSPANPPSH